MGGDDDGGGGGGVYRAHPLDQNLLALSCRTASVPKSVCGGLGFALFFAHRSFLFFF